MGMFSWFLSWFRRSKPTVINYEEILTQLQTELREWEEKKASAIASHRTAVTRLLLWACVLEVIFIVWYYFCTSPTDVLDHATYIAPALLIPILGYVAKRLISWIYNTRICKADEKLIALENQQAEKVEELKKATNFYKTAQLVQQFDRKSRTPAPAPRKQPAQPGRKVPATPGPPVAKRPSPPQVPATVGPAQRHARPASHPPPSASKAPPSGTAPHETPAPDEEPETPDLPVPVPGPRPVPPQRNGATAPTPSQGRSAARPTMPPPQTPSRSYYMPVPDRNNPVALPPSAQGQKQRGWLDSILDVMIGDNESNSVPVRCVRCNSLYGHVPRAEVGSYQFTCRKCRFWNDPLASTQASTSTPARQPQQQGRPSNKPSAHVDEYEDDMPDLPTDNSDAAESTHADENNADDRGELAEEEEEGEEHLLTDADPIAADDHEGEESAGTDSHTKSE